MNKSITMDDDALSAAITKLRERFGHDAVKTVPSRDGRILFLGVEGMGRDGTHESHLVLPGRRDTPESLISKFESLFKGELQ